MSERLKLPLKRQPSPINPNSCMATRYEPEIGKEAAFAINHIIPKVTENAMKKMLENAPKHFPRYPTISTDWGYCLAGELKTVFVERLNQSGDKVTADHLDAIEPEAFKQEYINYLFDKLTNDEDVDIDVPLINGHDFQYWVPKEFLPIISEFGIFGALGLKIEHIMRSLIIKKELATIDIETISSLIGQQVQLSSFLSHYDGLTVKCKGYALSESVLTAVGYNYALRLQDIDAHISSTTERDGIHIRKSAEDIQTEYKNIIDKIPH